MPYYINISCILETISVGLGYLLGCSQVVRQRVLVPPSVGSNPTTPATLYVSRLYMLRTPLPLWFYFLIFLFPLFFFFYGLGSYGLLNNNEGLYGEIARELLLSTSFQDWIIPRLNGVPYIEKPPLLYWLTGLSFYLFGETEWAARFFPALSGFFTVGIAGLFLLKIKQGKLFLPSVIFLSTSLGYLITARTVYFEGLLIFFLTLSLLSFYLAYTQKQKFYVRLFYIFMGLAFLTKGLIGPVLVILTLSVFILLEKSHRKNLFLFLDPLGLLLGASITLPWVVLATYYDSGFLWFFFINEHILRFLDLKEPRDYYRGPWWYYLPRILGYVFPWAPLFLSFRLFSKEKSPLFLFLKIWIIIPLLFYSFSRAKANYYMLISIVPLCILLAYGFIALPSKKRLLSFAALMIHLLCISVLIVGFFYRRELFSFSLLLSIGIPSFFCAVLFYIFQKHFPEISPSSSWNYRLLLPSGIFYAGVFCGLGVNGVNYISKENPGLSIKYFWKDMNSLKNIPPSLYIFRHYEELSSLLWYAERTIPIIDYEGGDLLYGKSKNLPKAQNLFVSSRDLPLSVNDLIVMHKKALPIYKNTPLFSQTQEIYQKGDIIVFRPK